MTDPLFQPLSPAQLNWQDEQPLSSRHDDVYFSKHDGLAETDYVFLQGNQLEERWQQLQGDDFVVAETGFGTGLNFLAAQQLWLQKTSTGTLHYLSAELFPLDKNNLQRSLNLWPSLQPLATSLVEHYPNLLPGIHRIHLPEHRTILTLLFGDATQLFSSLCASDHPYFAHTSPARVDAWFLDGFAPAKNPELWNPKLFNAIAQLSKPNHTTFSTFTAAGMVKRGLKEAGFAIEKVAGFGSKRDMLRGLFQQHQEPQTSNSTGKKHRPSPPWYLPDYQASIPKHAAVIGAGIAGCTTAHALARRGIKVTLIDRHPQVAQEGSGNPQGILFPRLSLRMGLLSRFALAALNYSLGFYQPIWRQPTWQQSLSQSSEEQPVLGADCGVILLPENDKLRADYQAMAECYPDSLVRLLDNAQLQELSGISLQQPSGLFFPQSGWINPAAVCQQLTNHPLIHYQQASVTQLVEPSHTDRPWQLLDSNNQPICQTDAVVVACANASKNFPQTEHLPLKPVRGQITTTEQTELSQNLKTVVCGAGYIAPAQQGQHSFGASYNLGETSLAVSEQDNLENLNRLATTDPALADVLGMPSPAQLQGRAALRATTPDYLPIAGAVPEYATFLESYAELRSNAKADIPHTTRYYPGLYVNCGHGSRGMTYAPLCAELIASQLSQQPAPLERDLLCATHPARFYIRALKRNRL